MGEFTNGGRAKAFEALRASEELHRATLTSISDAVFLTDFITERLGPLFYNQGLYDAQAILSKKADGIGEAILAIEKSVKL